MSEPAGDFKNLDLMKVIISYFSVEPESLQKVAFRIFGV